MLANIGDKLLRKLTARIELRQVPDNTPPNVLPATVDPGRRLGSINIK